MKKAYWSKATFVAKVDDVDRIYTRGTIVLEGDPILDRYPDMFEAVGILWETRGAAA